MGVVALIAGITAAATSIGTSVYAAENAPSAPKAPTQAQEAQQQAQAQQAAAQAQANALTKMRGMQSTILTSPAGQTNTPQTQKATLGA